MMSLGTWLAVAILGPGALAVFVWFLIDLRKILAGGKDVADNDRS